MEEIKKTSKDFVLLGIGLVFSILMVIVLPGLYFHKDLEAFWNWAEIWNANWRDIYVACAGCNYPILGMFSSAGIMSMLRGLGFDRAVFIYQLFLGGVDALNVVLVFWLFKMLAVKKAAYWAGVIGISVCSWAGGALWGQIDGVSQFFILLTLAWMVNRNTTNQPALKNFSFYLIISSILLGCVLLVKQLTLFSAFSLGLLLVTNILFYSREWKSFVANAGLALATFLTTILAWDIFLKLKEPYFSHLYYIWQEGTFQGGIISGNGFNIWMFMGRDMWSSAQVPFFANYPFFTPQRTGMFLFAAFSGVITLSLLLALKKQFNDGEKNLNRETLLNFIFHLALVNLCFNIFLTGTRDRYLYHFYPYILLAVVGLAGYSGLFSEKIITALVLGASFYGAFIFQILLSIDFRLGYLPHWAMGLFHLCLFGCLFINLLKYQKFKENINNTFRKHTKNLPTVR